MLLLPAPAAAGWRLPRISNSDPGSLSSGSGKSSCPSAWETEKRFSRLVLPPMMIVSHDVMPPRPLSGIPPFAGKDGGKAQFAIIAGTAIAAGRTDAVRRCMGLRLLSAGDVSAG
ncbi:MAG: hypothetical protein D6757_00290 [Alphaproteobacteria bacterium]|nr:MAG: hypothetical protein D6757_00290 [Alphaproteobacteria bacterium]